MANKSWIPASGALEVNVCELFGSITIGASGAVASKDGKGIGQVVKESSAGQYTINLDDSYNKLLWAGFTLQDGTDEDPATVGTHMRLNSVDVASTSAPKIVLQCYAGDDGADANPAEGAVIWFTVKLRNSSVS